MQVSEEVEAIEAMGIGPLRFLVAPRMLALLFLMPCLSTGLQYVSNFRQQPDFARLFQYRFSLFP